MEKVSRRIESRTSLLKGLTPWPRNFFLLGDSFSPRAKAPVGVPLRESPDPGRTSLVSSLTAPGLENSTAQPSRPAVGSELHKQPTETGHIDCLSLCLIFKHNIS